MTISLRLFLLTWSVLWTVGLPIILGYLGYRALKDRRYGVALAQRFGIYTMSMPGAVWIHAVSLGELRSAVPLIRELLVRGDRVVTTHFTPAGLHEAQSTFADEIARGQLCAVRVPFETNWAYRGFFRAFRPRLGLVMEIEVWPRMVFAARSAGVPLFMCNAQYPKKSLVRDTASLWKLRQQVMRGYAGAFVKSQLQADRFASIGVANIHVTGELRFQQPVPIAQVKAGNAARIWLDAAERPVITIASSIEGEDALYLHAIQTLRQHSKERDLPAPLIVYVPRRPERFNAVAGEISAAGFSLLRRTQLWSEDVAKPRNTNKPPIPDVLLGDSLGEMWFYLAMADQVIVGGGFQPAGSHNIIEPLMLKKPVITGPNTQVIEYPFVEALAAGVVHSVNNANELSASLIARRHADPDAIATFLDAHGGATAKTIAAIDRALDAGMPAS